MEQIEYFQVLEPVDFKRRTGRLVTAAVILFLTAMPFGLGTFGLTLSFMRYMRPDAREWLGLLTIAATFAGITGLFIWLGVGTVMRRRWCRPMVLAVAGPWLAVGMAFSTALLLVFAQNLVRNIAFASVTNLLEECGAMVLMMTVASGFPALLCFLLSPAKVRQTLETIDLRPRWTDTWTIGELSFLVINMTLAYFFGCFTADLFGTEWYYRIPWTSVFIACISAFALVATLLTRWKYRAAWCSGMLAAIAANATLICFLSDLDWNGYDRNKLISEDGIIWLAALAVGLALMVFLVIVRPRQINSPAMEPIDLAAATATANTQ